jgi:hypothetical protein
MGSGKGFDRGKALFAKALFAVEHGVNMSLDGREKRDKQGGNPGHFMGQGRKSGQMG